MNSRRCIATTWGLIAIATLTGFGQETEFLEKLEPTDQSWTQWRGPTRNGQVHSDALRHRSDLTGLQMKYRVELGESYSTPIVFGDLVFTTETRDKQDEWVRAFRRSTGMPVWEVHWPGAMEVPFFARANGDWIRSTPVYDSARLYVGGMRDVIVCLDASSGAELWRLDFVERFGSRLPDFGLVSSPLIDGDGLFVQAGGAVFRLDKHTGRVVWKSIESGADMMSSGAFSSPVVATLAGVRQLVVQTREELVGADLDSGEILWRQPVPHFRGMNILTPTVIGDRVFTSSYNHGSFLFGIQRDEATGAFSVSTIWQNKVQGYMSSPVVIDGHIYLHLQNQRLACLDAATGDERWRSPPFGKYWSLVASGDRLLALDERGELLLIRATPEKFDLIDRRKVADQSTWAHLVVVADELFIRELTALTAYH